MEQNPLLKNHMGYIDGLRAATALYVVWHHIWLSVYENIPNPALFKVFVYGREAVDIFIVLSGFCLTLPVLRNQDRLSQGAMGFYVRRAWRILPPFYAAMALSLVLIYFFLHTPQGTHWDGCLPVNAHSILFNLGMVHDFMIGPGDGTINYVFWSIAVEWRIYFLFPLLVILARQIGVVETVLGAVLLSVLIYWSIDVPFQIDFTSQFIGLFAMGILGAHIAYGTKGQLTQLKSWPWTWLTLGFALVAVLSGVIHFGEHSPVTAMKEYIFGLFAMSLIIAASFPLGWFHRLLSVAPLVYAGSFAYSIYLIHAPILALVQQELISPLRLSHLMTFILLTLIGFPSVIGASYLFFRLFEYPFLRKKSKTDREPTQRDNGSVTPAAV